MQREHRYENPEEIEVLIDEYFKECKTLSKPPTAAGMEMSLLNYQDKLYI